MFERFKKDKYLWGVLVIMLLAIFVRGWMFSDLLTFKMDQARDIKLVEEAYKVGGGKMTLEGLGELPLLGPRAAKTYLRLGPISYYFEYVALLIFGDKPWAMAMPDFIFSILTIPLFYYFLRQAFGKKISLLTTMLFAASFFLVQYGRFAWNPNSIPFWSLVYFLGLYKLVECQMSNVKCYKSGKWLLVVAMGYGVASQLHFTAALAYPLIGVLFVFGGLFLQSQNLKVKSRKSMFNVLISNLNWQYWLGAVVILGAMYLPMILSEIYTHGDNWVQFKYALSGRSKEEFTLYVKIVQSLKLHSEYFWFTLTSMSGGAGTLGVVGFVGVMGSLCVIFTKRMFFENQNINSQKSSVKSQISKNLFFLLIWIWFGVMFLLYTKLAFDVLKPRYWLLEAPVFFVMVASMLRASQKSKVYKIKNGLQKKSLRAHILILFMQGVIVSILVGMNLWAVGNWYWELQSQKHSKLFIWELKLKDENRIPWGQLQKSAKYIRKLSEKTKKDICFYTTGEYRPVYNYIFDKSYSSGNIRRISFSNDSNEECVFVTIDHQERREELRIPKKYKNEFVKIDNSSEEIGFITIWQVRRIEQSGKSANNENKNVVINNQGSQDVLIEERFGKGDDKITENLNNKNKVMRELDKNIAKRDSQEQDNEEQSKKPKRKERIRWKDIGVFFRNS